MTALAEELDRWAHEGRTVQVWLRDDDAVAATPALDRLLAIADRYRIATLIAAIPMKVEASLAPRLAACQHVRVAVHGAWHRNFAQAGEKAREFPPSRGWPVIERELTAARAALIDIFGADAGRCYVPPWNRIDPEVVARLPALGFTHLSAFAATPPASAPGLTPLHAHLDLIDWKGGRTGRAQPWLIAQTAFQLAMLRETGAAPRLGLLAHHLAHDAAAWDGLQVVLDHLVPHPAVRPLPADALFGD